MDIRGLSTIFFQTYSSNVLPC